MKLRDSLILRTVALAALVFGIFGAILIQSSFYLQLSREKEALEERSAQLVQSMEAAAVNYVLQNISPSDSLLAGVLEQLDSSASLYAADGNLPADGMHLSDRTLYALRPAQLAGQSYRIMTLSDLTALYQTRMSLLTAYVLLYLITMVLFTLIIALTARSLSCPIEHLASVSTQLASGDMNVRAQPDRHYETNALAHAFNHMADSLTAQIERQQRFIADLTHEMKTPLTAIIGHADLIRSGRVFGDETLFAAHSIFKEGQRLNALTACLIDLILLNKDQVDLYPHHVRPLIEEAAESLRPTAAKRGIELITCSEDAIILCDRPLMLSLIANLIDNALKSGAAYVRAEGKLTAEVYTLRIIDDGCGMSPDVLQKITEPFYRADKSRSRQQGGAGLGLSLCAEITRIHHAILSFDSAPGQGTAACLSLLLKESDENDQV